MFDTKLYQVAPVIIQEILISLRALVRKLLREGKDYRVQKASLEGTQWLSEKELDLFQMNELNSVINHALKHVPYYRKKYLGNGPDVDSTTFVDFEFLQKEDLRKNTEMFLADDVKETSFANETGGTTGTPLQLRSTLSSIIFEQAHISRQLDWAGYKKGEKRAWLRADMIVPLKEKAPPFWRRNITENMLMLSAYHLNGVNVSLYVEELERFNPALIQAYPSAIIYIAKHLRNNRVKYAGRALKSIVTSSEALTLDDKSLLEETMGCNVFDWYGSSERTVAIGTCEAGRLHIIEDYGFLETVKTVDERDEVIGTSFGNRLMPLIRYCSGDAVVLSSSRNCTCGRHFRLVEKVDGRIGDHLLSTDGNTVTILNHIPKGVGGLVECQFVQNKADQIEAHIVVETQFNETNENHLVSNIRKYLGGDMSVKIVYVESIARTSSGKFRQAICNII